MVRSSSLDFRYADPATGHITSVPHRSWIAHRINERQAKLVIPCRLHGTMHAIDSPTIYHDMATYYATTADAFGSVLLAAISPTCDAWATAKRDFERRLRFTWTSPVENLILTVRAFGKPARLRTLLAASVAMSVPTRPFVALDDDLCRLRCRTHGWESVAHLYPVTTDHLESLSCIVAQIGIVLATSTFTTCEQVVISYEHLHHEITNPPSAASWNEMGTAHDAYLHAARVLHRFLSDRVRHHSFTGIAASVIALSHDSDGAPWGAGAPTALVSGRIGLQEAFLVSDFTVESERTLRRHGLICRIRRVNDETSQPDSIAEGEFVEHEADDTIPVPESVQRELADYTRMSVDHLRHYRNQHLPPDTGEELRYAREDLRRLADYYLDKWHYLGILVEIFLPATFGNGLGTRLAQSSVWGIDSDSDEVSFRSLEDEQIAEAEAAARETAAQITAIPFLTVRTSKTRGRAAGRRQTAA